MYLLQDFYILSGFDKFFIKRLFLFLSNYTVVLLPDKERPVNPP